VRATETERVCVRTGESESEGESESKSGRERSEVERRGHHSGLMMKRKKETEYNGYHGEYADADSKTLGHGGVRLGRVRGEREQKW
jgi:hypothetical protein